MNMRAYLQRVMTEGNWPAEAVESILAYYDRFATKEVCSQVLNKWLEAYREDMKLDYLRANEEVDTAAVSAGLGGYEAQLLLYLCLSRYLWDYYEKAGLPAEVCLASLEDLKWKAIECHHVYGVWGSFVASWFAGFFRLTRFTLGRLQFEEIAFPEDYPADGKLCEREIDVVLNMHIPSAGPLNREKCVESYKMAAEFWEKYYHRTSPVFCCLSWLLYPEHEKFLPETSNILRFQRDFDIYTSWTDKEGEDLWRIFGGMYDGHPENLAENTSLQKAYKQWLLDGNLPGEGRGFLKLSASAHLFHSIHPLIGGF